MDTVSYRPLTPADVAGFHGLLAQIDTETRYMMFEPGERPVRSRGGLGQGA